ncbi:hypothetical protein Tco_1361101 [Tanacetum coccineum]
MKASLQGKDNAIKKLKMQISQLKETRSEADRTLDFRALDFQITHLTEKVTVLQEQNELFRAENEKVKQHYKELYDSIKITRAKHIEQITALLTENENLKAQIQNKMKCVTKDHVKPTVLAPGKYAIDVEPIPPRNRNNREVHLDYLKHLKESVETLREIVEEAKVERPLDRSIVSACRYTKHSQELLEYAIGTCPKDFNQRDKKHAPTPLIRKKQVAFEAKYDTSNRVNCCTDASGSQLRSNTKKNRISPVKSVNKTKVKEHPRTNKSNVNTANLVDSSISSKRNAQKCLADENLVIPLEEIQLDDKLHFIEEPVEIMDREVKQLKQSRIPIVKVRWNSRRGLTTHPKASAILVQFLEDLKKLGLVSWVFLKGFDWGFVGRVLPLLEEDTMADVNVNAPAEQAPAMAPPTRTDEQILPRSRWVPVGKSNCYLDVERSQSNPIYKISVDILKHTNFFRAFIASSTIPSIYIQQFWDTVRYDKTTGSYSCQLDEQWFDLTKDTLRDALQITPVDNNNAFSSSQLLMSLSYFVNDSGLPKVVKILIDVVTNACFSRGEHHNNH